MEIPGEISLLCRLCLANDEVNVPIFGEQSDIRQISLKISSCLPVKIAADDLLPKNICEGCSDKLELLYTFSKTSQEAEKKLLVWVEQVSVNNASEAITAVAKQIVDSTEVKEESDEGHKVNVKKSFDELVEDAEEKEPESEAPPPKRARRTAAVKAQISISQESEDEDDVDMVEPLTKVEDESEVSDSESVEPHSSFVDVPGTSADEQQPGPSGVQKDGADAPSDQLFYGVLDKGITIKPFKCEQCGKSFARKGRLNQHILYHKRQVSRPFECPQCPKKFMTKWCLRSHLLVHSNAEPSFCCDICNRKFYRKSSLRDHQKRTHYLENYVYCELCGRKFAHIRDYRQHERIHSKDRDRMTCNVCGKSFTSQFFPRHMKLTHGETGEFSCKRCEKMFSTEGDLARHVKNYHRNAPRVCEICGKHVKCLKVHLEVHEGIKNHKCSHCDKAFVRVSNLRLHERTHTGEKPYTCTHCQAKFTQSGSLRLHVRKFHLIKEEVRDGYCPEGSVEGTEQQQE